MYNRYEALSASSVSDGLVFQYPTSLKQAACKMLLRKIFLERR